MIRKYRSTIAAGVITGLWLSAIYTNVVLLTVPAIALQITAVLRNWRDEE